MSQQPEALQLAEALERNRILPCGDNGNTANDAATELRRLHAETLRLRTLFAIVQNLSDMEMGDGDGAREIARLALRNPTYKPYPYWSQDTLQAIRQADAGGPLD